MNKVKMARDQLNNNLGIYGVLAVLMAGGFDMIYPQSSYAQGFGLVICILFIILVASLVIRYVDYRFSLLEKKINANKEETSQEERLL